MRPVSKRHILFAALAAGGFVAAAGAASIQIHKQPNFTGAHVTLTAESQNLQSINFHDQASSLVLDGTWEVCTRPKFNGHCEVLGPGRYSKLEQSLNHRIESVRPVTGAKVAREESGSRHGWKPDERERSDGREGRPGWKERQARAGAIDIYPGPEFRGRPMRVDRDLATLEENSERASSLVIHEGTWQLCTQAFYEGWCRTFEPGRYASLGRLDNKVASAKLVR